ncbi:MAG TPA: DUF1573 domain-containing protein [Chitinophagaceae bacterium]|jgi:hypothetical protein|nr:DUF1573 domain-containing protein [Chitinophagaceae bacterium]
MKYILITLLSTTLLYACNSGDASATKDGEDSVKRAQAIEAASDSANYTTIEWIDSTAQNLGKLKEGQVAEVTWRFKNTGDKPLIILSANPSCGCTLAEKPEQPITPGGEGVIKAKFDTKSQGVGTKEKTVMVQTNTKNMVSHQLSFRAEVIK